MPQSRLLLLAELAKVDPLKPLDPELFSEGMRIWGGVSIEAVCIREIPNVPFGREVYLTQRAVNDPFFPGQPWHVPGSYYRAEEYEEHVFRRLIKEELGANITSRRFVANKRWKEPRGWATSTVYFCRLDETGTLKGKWFDVDQLPENIIAFHRDEIIPVAVWKSQTC